MKNALLMTFLMLVGIADAQKLPAVQKGGMHAPANVKIDGKITEWGDLKAYNQATQVYYTIANDAERLYLAIKIANGIIINKAARGGITLGINPVSKKKSKALPSVTFPMYEKGGPAYFQIVDNKPQLTGITDRDKKTGDSLARVKNSTLSRYLKWIGTINITGITDSLISVYNDEGVKVAYAIDGDLNFNYELAIPLKSLGLTSASHKFYYNIQLNGESFYYAGVQEFRPGYFSMIKADGTGVMMSGDRSTHADKIFPTDFWGEYTLAQ